MGIPYEIIYIILIIFLSWFLFKLYKLLPNIDWWKYYKAYSNSVRLPFCLKCQCTDDSLKYFRMNRVVSIFLNYIFIIIFLFFWVLVIITKIWSDLNITNLDEVLINSESVNEIYKNILSVPLTCAINLVLISIILSHPLVDYILSCISSQKIKANPEFFSRKNLIKSII